MGVRVIPLSIAHTLQSNISQNVMFILLVASGVLLGGIEVNLFHINCFEVLEENM